MLTALIGLACLIIAANTGCAGQSEGFSVVVSAPPPVEPYARRAACTAFCAEHGGALVYTTLEPGYLYCTCAWPGDYPFGFEPAVEVE
jgi:putative hemolysin